MITIIVGVLAFVAGALVFRNNSAAANKIISKVEDDATKNVK